MDCEVPGTWDAFPVSPRDPGNNSAGVGLAGWTGESAAGRVSLLRVPGMVFELIVADVLDDVLDVLGLLDLFRRIKKDQEAKGEHNVVLFVFISQIAR